MKRKILALICLVLVFSMIFASCSEVLEGEGTAAPDQTTGSEVETSKDETPTDGECEHTFSADWSSDATQHWHRATCEHGEIKSGLAAHVDANEDGLCDVCAYEIGHEHTFSDEWTYDASKHWKKATCSHVDEKSGEALHADDDKNYKCDVCAAHVHILNTTTGYCDGCGEQLEEIDTTDLATLINALLANSKKVVSGKVDYDAIFRGLDMDFTLAHDVEYKLYTDGFYTKRTEKRTEEDWVNEVWRKLNGEEVTAVSVEKVDGVVVYAEPSAESVESLAGYYYSVSTLADGYGAENIISVLYELSKPEDTSTNKVYDYAEEINTEDRTVEFSYKILVINTDTAAGEDDGADYYEVKVVFGYNAATVLTSLTITCDCYTNSLEDEAEQDYVYDQATKTITMKDTAKADTYTFVVTQTQGAQTAIDMPPVKMYYPEELSFAVNGEAVDSLTLSATCDESNPWPEVELICDPVGSYVSFIRDDLVISVFEKGTQTDAKAKLMVTLQGDGLSVLPVGIAGEFTVVLTLGDFSASFDVTVQSAQGDQPQPTGGSFTFTATDNNTFDGQEYTFTASASGKYTFYIPAGFGACDKAAYENHSAPYVDPYLDANGGSFTVAIAEGGTYTFLILSPVKGVECTFYYDFVAQEVEGGDSGNGGGNVNPSVPSGTLTVGNNTLVFSQAEIDANAAERPLVITTASKYMFKGDAFVSAIVDANGNEISKNADYSYDLAAGEYTVKFGMFSIFNTQADTAIPMNVEDKNATGGNEGGNEGGDQTIVYGTYTGTDMFGNAFLTVTVTETEVTFTFNHPMMGHTVTYTYTVTEGTVTLYDEQNTPVNPLAGKLEIDENGTPVSADYNGTSYTLAAGGNSPEGGADDAEGSQNNPIEITLPAEDLGAEKDSIGFTWYTFTTTQPGKITITFSNANSWVRIINVDDAEDSNSGSEKETFIFKVKANSTYNLGLGVWNPEEGVTASVSFEYVEESPLAEKGNLILDDETSFEVTDDDIIAGGFTAILSSADAGEYDIYSGYFLVESVVADETGTVIERNDNGCFELEAYTAYVVTISTEYISDAGEYTVCVEYQYPEGHENNPSWLYSLGESVTAAYKGDYMSVWYTFYADGNGTVTVTTSDEAALIMIKPVGGMDITNTDEEYNLVSSVSINVMAGRQYMIGVTDANWSEEAREIVFTPTFTEGEYLGDGSMNNPNVLVDGSNTANVPAWETTYFVYTATGNGTLTLTTENANCYWAIATEFGDFEYSTEATLSIKLEMDAKLYVAVSTADGEAGNIAFAASFEADPVESWYEEPVINDGSAPNVIELADNTFVSLPLYGMGEFVLTWDNADAVVEIRPYYGPNTPVMNGGTVAGDSFGVDLIVYLPEYAAGTVNLTIAPYVPAVEDGNSFVLGENVITVQDNQVGDAYALPVNAEENVTYVITVGANGVVINTTSGNLYFEGDTVEVLVPTGETVSLNVGAYSSSDPVAYVTVAEKVSQEIEEGEATTETLTFVVPTISSMFTTSEVQSVTIGASGSYVISATGYDNILNTRLQYYDATEDSWVTIARTPGHESHLIPYVIELSAGDVLQLRIQTWNSADAGNEIVVTVAPNV